MGLKRARVKTPGPAALLARSSLCLIGLFVTFSHPACEAFNLAVEDPAVYSGPEGSYFGYAVDFYLSESASASLVVGAPKANTRQLNVTAGGSVFYCPWSLSQADCHTIDFDTEGDRSVMLNDVLHQVDFKSHQWFGATVRSHGDTILACAPLYSWRTEKDVPRSDATGTCYLSVKNFTKFVEYAPCRTEISDEGGQGYCQGGFSADFTMDGKVVLGGPGSYFWQGQVISAAKEDIIKAYYPGYFMQAVEGQIQTKQVQAAHDDSYQGYSVAVGEFSGDQVEGRSIKFNSQKHVCLQMGSYFGYALATTDINSDGMVDLLVGAPMLMVRGSSGRLEEMGQVYVFLQRGPLNLEELTPYLTGTQVFGRFGTAIAPLGDLNQDGFNDVAISCPFGGDDQQGLVYIYNGHSEGLQEKPSQVITGQWAAGTFPASFGFALRGAQDLDMNGYPDLIVGAFGVNKAVLYRYVEVQLDSHKHKQKGAVSRALFLDSQQPLLQRSVRVRRGERRCNHTQIYLRDEKDFRDKLSSIFVALNFSLDPKAAADSHGLRPILNYQTTKVYLGDDNSLTLTFNARNEGEGGAYEADLYVVMPPEADYSGIARNKSLTQLTCSYDTENQTRFLSCDLGNPMKAGTNLWAGLRFTVPRLKDTHKTVQFDVQIRSKNENNSHSEVVSHKLDVVVQADVILQGTFWEFIKNLFTCFFLQLVNNGPSQISSTSLELRCPLLIQSRTLLYPLEFSTEGSINCTADRHMNHLNLKVSIPHPHTHTHTHTQARAHAYTPGLAHLTNLCWAIQCNVGLLEKGTTAILKVRSRIWAKTFTEVSGRRTLPFKRGTEHELGFSAEENAAHSGLVSSHMSGFSRDYETVFFKASERKREFKPRMQTKATGCSRQSHVCLMFSWLQQWL
uniref:Integrin subunit alpha 5 n=1 Tax=Nothobranchius furzeri TaxID=105023 RepID=A0A8C6M1Y9_NOTFU